MIDEMGRKYIRHSDEPYSSGTLRLLTCINPGSDYRARLGGTMSYIYIYFVT